MAGLTAEQILESRRGSAADGKSHALLHFCRKLVDARGQASGR